MSCCRWRVAALGAVGALSAVGAVSPAAAAPGVSSKAPFIAQLVARSFFRSLVAGEVSALRPLCADTVNFDGERVAGEAVAPRLAKMVARAHKQRLRLRRIELLSLAQMKRRFGPPPARLGGALRPGQQVALARFDRLGAVAVLQRFGRFWRIVALTD